MSFEKANIGREIVDSITKVSQSIRDKKFLREESRCSFE